LYKRSFHICQTPASASCQSSINSISFGCVYAQINISDQWKARKYAVCFYISLEKESVVHICLDIYLYNAIFKSRY